MEHIHSIEKQKIRRGTSSESDTDGLCFGEMQTGPVNASIVEEEEKNRAQPMEEPFLFF